MAEARDAEAGLDTEAAELLGRIHAEQREVGERIEPPADEAAIAELDATLRAQFGAGLPPGWAAFLRHCDGLDFNGFTLYATRQRDGTAVMLGMPEQNFVFRAGARGARHLLLGETGDDYFAHDLTAGDFCVFGRATGSVYERFPDASGLLRHVLATAWSA